MCHSFECCASSPIFPMRPVVFIVQIAWHSDFQEHIGHIIKRTDYIWVRDHIARKA